MPWWLVLKTGTRSRPNISVDRYLCLRWSAKATKTIFLPIPGLKMDWNESWFNSLFANCCLYSERGEHLTVLCSGGCSVSCPGNQWVWHFGRHEEVNVWAEKKWVEMLLCRCVEFEKSFLCVTCKRAWELVSWIMFYPCFYSVGSETWILSLQQILRLPLAFSRSWVKMIVPRTYFIPLWVFLLLFPWSFSGQEVTLQPKCQRYIPTCC